MWYLHFGCAASGCFALVGTCVSVPVEICVAVQGGNSLQLYISDFILDLLQEMHAQACPACTDISVTTEFKKIS